MKNIKVIILTIIFTLCIAFISSVNAESLNVGRLAYNLGNGTISTSGKKVNGLVATLRYLADEGIITISNTKQSFDLNNDGIMDISFGFVSNGTVFIGGYNTEMEPIPLEVPQTVKNKLINDGYNYADNIYFTFKPTDYYNLTVGLTPGGIYKIKGITYDYPSNHSNDKEEIIQIEAVPSSGYTFKGWYDGIIGSSYYVENNTSELISKDKTITVNKDMSLQAVFEKNKSNTVVTKITKKANPMTVTAKNKKIKYKKVKKKKQVVSAITVSKAQGKVTYAKVSGNKKIKVNKTTGKITVKKKTKKGTYKIKVKVNAAGNSNYKAGSKIVTFKIKVK